MQERIQGGVSGRGLETGVCVCVCVCVRVKEHVTQEVISHLTC